MSNKRGSLSISTNAIVVLIIAVIMLGLIIGLVTRGFTAVERQFMERIQATEDSAPPPTGTEPITMSRQTIVSSGGELVGMKVGIRNVIPATASVTERYLRPGSIDCKGGAGNPIEEESDMVFPKYLGTGQTAEFSYIFRLRDTLQPGRYLCEMRAAIASETDDSITTDPIANQIRPFAQFTLTVE